MKDPSTGITGPMHYGDQSFRSTPFEFDVTAKAGVCNVIVKTWVHPIFSDGWTEL